jgi:hypothetical protein
LIGAGAKRHQLPPARLYAVNELCAKALVHSNRVHVAQRTLGEENAPAERQEHRQADRE